LILGGFSTARRLVRALNDALGIDAAAEHAMLVGCLRGWNGKWRARNSLALWLGAS
jgi:hypothetical protein